MTITRIYKERKEREKKGKHLIDKTDKVRRRKVNKKRYIKPPTKPQSCYSVFLTRSFINMKYECYKPKYSRIYKTMSSGFSAFYLMSMMIGIPYRYLLTVNIHIYWSSQFLLIFFYLFIFLYTFYHAMLYVF